MQNACMYTRTIRAGMINMQKDIHEVYDCNGVDVVMDVYTQYLSCLFTLFLYAYFLHNHAYIFSQFLQLAAHVEMTAQSERPKLNEEESLTVDSIDGGWRLCFGLLGERLRLSGM